MGPIQTIPELLSWLRRRALLIGFVAFLGALAGVLAALANERIYAATSVIQVVNPVIADDAAGASTSTVRRVQMIEQQLMSRENMLAMAERHDMFPAHADRPAERVALMRQSIRIQSIAAAHTDGVGDGAISALIITATAGDPVTAAAIANELADMLLSQSASDREARIEQALRFHQQEEARLEAEIETLGNELIAFQTENESLLSSALALRREELRRLEDGRLQLERDMVQFRNELATLDPISTRVVTQRRIAQLNDEITRRNGEMALIDERIDVINQLLLRAPEVEREASAMQRRLTQLQGQLATTADRRREVEIEQRIVADRQSERFALLEAALVPQYPVSRSRKAIASLGVIAGVMGGLVLAYLVEWANPVLRTAAQMERVLALRPVISIPYVEPPSERRRRRMIWALGLGVLLAGLALVMASAI